MLAPYLTRYIAEWPVWVIVLWAISIFVALWVISRLLWQEWHE